MCMGCRSALRGGRVEIVKDGLDAIEEAARCWERAAEELGAVPVQPPTAAAQNTAEH